MSQRPNVFCTLRASCSTEANSVISQTTASHCPPAAEILAAVACKGSGERPHTITVAPRLARRSAIAAPMPRPPPVTIAIFPSKERSRTGILHPLCLKPAKTAALASISVHPVLRDRHLTCYREVRLCPAACTRPTVISYNPNLMMSSALFGAGGGLPYRALVRPRAGCECVDGVSYFPGVKEPFA